jgi:hypothetical protein
MSDQRAATQLPPDAVVPREGARSGWVGMAIFAGMMMVLVGVFNLVDGLVALFNDAWYDTRAEDLLAFNYAAWGWLMVLFGVVAIAAGLGVMAGQTWARVVGVIMAGLNAVAQLAFLNSSPVWSVLIIVLDVLVIYALTAHGGELAQGR